MVWGLCNLPLNIKNYKEELDIIKEIAKINGYNNRRTGKKAFEKIRLKNITTLIKDKKIDELTRRKISYIGRQPFQISKILKKFNIQCVFGSGAKTSDILGHPKDKLPDF